MRPGLLRLSEALVSAALLAGCGKDPAQSVTIALDGLTDGGVDHGASRTRRPWRPALCPPLPEPPAPAASHLTFGGACAFEHAGAAHCEVLQDDLYVTLSRPSIEGAIVTLFVNVERYHGDGRYDGAQVQVAVQDRGASYRWTSDGASVTVESGATVVRFDRTALSPEPGTSTEGEESLEGIAVCSGFDSSAGR